LPGNENEIEIISGIKNGEVKKNDFEIVQFGKSLRVIAPLSETVSLKIYDATGKFLKDFGEQQQNEYSLNFLQNGIYLATATTSFGSISLKIIL
jgi:hypothetical protein